MVKTDMAQFENISESHVLGVESLLPARVGSIHRPVVPRSHTLSYLMLRGPCGDYVNPSSARGARGLESPSVSV